MTSLRLLTLIIVAVSILACGRKTPPFPIEKSIPQEPDLEIEATPLGFNLWITLPDKTKSGLPLNKIRALIIEKEKVSIENQKTISKTTIKLKPKLHSAGRIFLYTDTELEERSCYIYRLKLEKDILVSTSFTQGQKACWTTPPKPPSQISFERTFDGNLIVTWIPPSTDLNGAPLTSKISYRIIKFTNNQTKYYHLEAPPFIDTPEDFKLCYRIQTIIDFHKTLILGPLSDIFCIN